MVCQFNWKHFTSLVVNSDVSSVQWYLIFDEMHFLEGKQDFFLK